MCEISPFLSCCFPACRWTWHISPLAVWIWQAAAVILFHRAAGAEICAFILWALMCEHVITAGFPASDPVLAFHLSSEVRTALTLRIIKRTDVAKLSALLMFLLSSLYSFISLPLFFSHLVVCIFPSKSIFLPQIHFFPLHKVKEGYVA